MEQAIEIRGLAELADILEQLPAKMQKQAVTEALRAGAQVIVEEAKHNAPRASGKLADSIRATISVDISNNGVGVQARISTKSRIAHLVEFGTSAHEIKVKRRKVMASLAANQGGRGMKGYSNLGYAVYGTRAQHPGTRAHPFLRPALDTQARQAVKVFSDKLREAIIRIVQRDYKKRMVNGR